MLLARWRPWLTKPIALQICFVPLAIECLGCRSGWRAVCLCGQPMQVWSTCTMWMRTRAGAAEHSPPQRQGHGAHSPFCHKLCLKTRIYMCITRAGIHVAMRGSCICAPVRGRLTAIMMLPYPLHKLQELPRRMNSTHPGDGVPLHMTPQCTLAIDSPAPSTSWRTSACSGLTRGSSQVYRASVVGSIPRCRSSKSSRALKLQQLSAATRG